jgi:hypothetical protein
VLAALRPASTIATVDAIPTSRFISKSRTPRGDYTIKIDFCDANGKKLALFEGLKLHVTSRLISTFDQESRAKGKVLAQKLVHPRHAA